MQPPALSYNKRFLIGVLLNVGFIAIEVFYGVKSHSMALIADAVHNVSDVLGLFVAWFGYLLAHKTAPSKFTFGFKNATIIAAFINAILLFVAVIGLAWEALHRLEQQESITSSTIIMVATIGVVINGLTAYLFFQGKDDDINIKGAFLHMFLDAAISLGVVVAGFLMLWTSWTWIDPVISLMIAAVIFIGSWQLLKGSLDLMLLAVPANIDLKQLKKMLDHYPGLISYHDLHVWPLSTTEAALSAHLVVKQESFQPLFLKELEEKLQQDFAISHLTLQLEVAERAEKCATDCSQSAA
jgi:cobalt-zinc-cadmium efflux system protein